MRLKFIQTQFKLNYKMKLSKFKNYINIAEITEIVLSSKATTARTTSVSITGIVITFFYTSSFCYCYSMWLIIKTLNTKI